jgi:5-oxoprolinase (ATP-hydrolysing)
MEPGSFSFSIDRGGTFTDVYAVVPDAQRPTRVLKLLSVDPANYEDAPREAIRRIIEEVTGVKRPRDEPLDHSLIGSIRMGTTVATNALLERKGARMALLITRGFSDLLHIGTQNRPRIFDLQIAMPANLYESVVEIAERVILVKEGEALPGSGTGRIVTGQSGEQLYIETAPDVDVVRAQLQTIKKAGISALSVVFLHSFLFPDHERLVAAIARDLGFTQVSISSEVMPMVKVGVGTDSAILKGKCHPAAYRILLLYPHTFHCRHRLSTPQIVPRGFTSCADAYLTPHIRRYIESFKAGFKNSLAGA